MPNSYLPQTDGGLRDWSANFSAQLAGMDPTKVGITVEEATAYAALQADYATKYAAAVNPDTRGSATVLAKNQAKKLLITDSRKLAMAANNYPATTDQRRHDLGLTIRDTDPSPVPVPDTMPRITFLPSNGLTVHFKVNDVDETKRGKPPEVTAALVYTYVGETAPLDITQWQFQGPTTKTKTHVTFPADTPGGSTTWFTAVWVNRKMQPGPASQPVSINIAGGGVKQKAA